MKSYLSFILPLTALCVITSCGSNTGKQEPKDATTVQVRPGKSGLPANNDTICAFHQIFSAAKTNLAKDFSDVNNTFLFKDTLYLLCTGTGRILQVDLHTNMAVEEKALNDTVALISKKLGYLQQLHVTNTNIYVGFAKGVVCLNKDFTTKYVIRPDNYYNYLSVSEAGNVIIFSDADWTIYKVDGQISRQLATDGAVYHFYPSDSGIYCDQDFSLKKIVLSGDSLQKLDNGSPGKFADFEPFLHDYAGFITKNHIFWFNFAKRNALIVTDKDITKIEKNISFAPLNWGLSRDELNDAAGVPDFFVNIDGDNYYISAITGNVLTIYKGCLQLSSNHK